MHPRRLLVLAVLPALAASLSACAASPRTGETDRIARVVGDAISFPRQHGAAGWAYAAQQTAAGRDGRLSVIAARDRPDGTVRLLLRVHLDAGSDGWNDWPAITSCYEQEYGRYGITTSRRQPCPHDATPIGLLPSPPPTIGGRVPRAFERGLAALLRHQSRRPSEDEVREQVTSRLAASGRGGVLPRVDVAVSGDDVGVALRSDDECLLGARLDDRVRVYVAPPPTVEPGEMPCDAATAMGPRLVPPH